MKKNICIIIPCFNEEDNISSVIKELSKYFVHSDYGYHIIFVDDGSTDNTYDIIAKQARKRKDIGLVKLSRNFGKEAAIAAGLNACEADAAIIMDSDLQHPPYLVAAMIEEWEAGANIVDAVKSKRQRENFIYRFLSLFFNFAMGFLTEMDFRDATDFKLLDRKAINFINKIEEKNRFFRGLTSWVGLHHSKIEFQVEERHSGQSKWNFYKLFHLSIDAVTSYSSKPLQIVTFLGAINLLFSIILSLQTLYSRFYGETVSGFTTVVLVLLITSSIIMISMGVIGIYLGKIYQEIKNRPIYLIEEKLSLPKDD